MKGSTVFAARLVFSSVKGDGGFAVESPQDFSTGAAVTIKARRTSGQPFPDHSDLRASEQGLLKQKPPSAGLRKFDGVIEDLM